MPSCMCFRAPCDCGALIQPPVIVPSSSSAPAPQLASVTNGITTAGIISGVITALVVSWLLRE